MAKSKKINRKAEREKARADLVAAAEAEALAIDRRGFLVERYLDTVELYAENLAAIRSMGIAAATPDGTNPIYLHAALSRLLSRHLAELGLTPAGVARPAVTPPDRDADSGGGGSTADESGVVYLFEERRAK